MIVRWKITWNKETFYITTTYQRVLLPPHQDSLINRDGMESAFVMIGSKILKINGIFRIHLMTIMGLLWQHTS